MKRRAAFWLVLSLVVLLMVPILSTIVFSLLDQDGVFGLIGSLDDKVVTYFTVFGLVFADAVVPIFPGETTLRSGPLLIACGRFVPGVRFAVNVSMGLTEYPYRRFLLFSAVGGTAWAIYTCVLAYFVSTAIADFALASIVISALITSVLVAGVYWTDRHRRVEEDIHAA